MFSGPPLPLPSDLPLRYLWPHAPMSGSLGAWMRGSPRRFRLSNTSNPCRGSIVVCADLGFLLRQCSRIALREQTQLVVLETDLLIQWRTLQVVTATPFLPGLKRLSVIFPGAHLDPNGFQVAIPTHSPEQVLAECLTHGIPVAGSRIVYAVPPTTPPHCPWDPASTPLSIPRGGWGP
jgi:hypothetical protein